MWTSSVARIYIIYHALQHLCGGFCTLLSDLFLFVRKNLKWRHILRKIKHFFVALKFTRQCSRFRQSWCRYHKGRKLDGKECLNTNETNSNEDILQKMCLHSFYLRILNTNISRLVSTRNVWSLFTLIILCRTIHQ